MKKGNKQNAFLNREYAAHMRRWGKFFTSRARRMMNKKVIQDEMKEV